MRNQREVKIVTTNLESLLEEKKQQENRLSVINSVIDNYKTWITDERNSQFTFVELLTQFAELPNQRTVERTSIQQNLPSQEPARNEQANNELIQKVMNRLDVFEEAISSLKSSNQRNENQFSSINQLCQDLNNNFEKKLAEHTHLYETFIVGQTESLQVLDKELQDQRELVDGVSKRAQSIEDENKEKFANLNDDISATQISVWKMNTAASSTSSQVGTLSVKIRELVNQMSTFRTVAAIAARQEKHLYTKISDVDSKIGTVCTLMLTKMATLRNAFGNQMTDQIKRKKMETKSPDTSTKLEAKSLEQLPGRKGFYLLKKEGGAFLNLKLSLRPTISPTESDKQILSLRMANNIKYETNIEGERESGIVKVESNGVYFIYCEVVFTGVEPSETYLSLVSRKDDKILSMSTICALKASHEAHRVIKIIYLERGKEICLQTSTPEHRGIHVKSFVCIHLM